MSEKRDLVAIIGLVVIIAVVTVLFLGPRPETTFEIISPAI